MQQGKQEIGAQIWPQVLSTIKFLMIVPIWLLGSAGLWGPFSTLGLFNIWLDRADGDWARRIKKVLGAPIWKHGPAYNGATDLWQIGFLFPVLPDRWPWIVVVIGAIGWLMNTFSPKNVFGEIGRFILITNSLISMTIAFVMVAQKPISDEWIAASILMTAFLLFYLTAGSWKKGVLGTR